MFGSNFIPWTDNRNKNTTIKIVENLFCIAFASIFSYAAYNFLFGSEVEPLAVSSQTQSNGIIVNDIIQLHNKVIVTTENKDDVNSPILDSARMIGKNAADVVNDDTNKGAHNSFEDSIAALYTFSPLASLTEILSDITTPLSTSIPSDIINAAREI